MDFTLDEAQQAVADLAANVLRSDADDEATWKSMSQAGLLSLALPESVGGDGMGAVAVGLVLAEAGKQARTLPALATLALAALPIAAFGNADQQRELLGEVGNGRVLTAALRPRGPEVQAERDELIGTWVGVPFAEQAAAVLMPVGEHTYVVDPRHQTITLTRTPTSSGAPEYTLRCSGTPAQDRLACSADDLDRYAVAGAAAQAAGLLAGALDLTATHLRTRNQFGRPLATFQAVAQQIADVYITARAMQLVAQSAAWRLETGRDAHADLETAAYWLATEAPKAVQTCHHLHGGLGVDVSYPLHRYYSHVKDLARFAGGSEYRLDRLGA